ncbi:hypothetical protein ACN38_g1729 [Penicillium nordicum]|uniref:Transcription factor domain-containing protein n=1 Tax=Penicillium nordicum TaxID=229535 RepID=A0A0M9WJJ7_9EURO|nr:hypothetical protein ACN38_g1729 [Penicillium nordicum]
MCRQKGKVCVYDAENLRGRRKCSVPQSNCTKPELDLQELNCNVPPRLAYGTSGQELERIFQQNMKNRPIAPVMAKAVEDRPLATSLFSIAPDMLEMLLLRFGHLGFGPAEHRPRFFATCLAQDTTETMFEIDLGVSVNSPLTSIDSSWMMQLIDIWFSIHPFSVLISKTLLLQSIKDGVYDQALLAILLSDAIATLATHVPESNRPSLLVESAALAEWSMSQVCTLAVNVSNISTAQTLLLLGWHHLHRSQARRATSYIQLAAQIINDLRSRLSTAPNTAPYRIKINGFQVIDVEHEVLHNMDSVTSSLRLWILMQTEDGDSPAQKLADIPVSFPPVDEFSSRMTVLDIASGHDFSQVSTIRAQATVARLLWPLSQLTATLGHVYILAHWYQNTTGSHDKIPSQTRHLHQLRQLAGNGLDKESLCSRIRLCLQEALRTMQEASSSSSLEAIVKVTYLTIMIHMLFPHGPFESWTLNEEVLGDFLTEAGSLLNTISSFTRDHPLLKAEAAGCFSTAAEIFSLGLGVCVRVMQYISSRQLTGSETERDMITANSTGLAELLSQIHQTAKSEIIMQTKRIESILHELEGITLDTGITHMSRYNDLETQGQHLTGEFILQLDSWNDDDLTLCSGFPLLPEAWVE